MKKEIRKIRNERNYRDGVMTVLFFLHERIHDSTILSINTPSSETTSHFTLIFLSFYLSLRKTTVYFH